MRFGETRDEHIEVRNGVVSSLSDGESAGFSVRALVDGAWGFASSADMSDAELDRVAALAVSIAKASAKVKRSRHLACPEQGVRRFVQDAI